MFRIISKLSSGLFISSSAFIYYLSGKPEEERLNIVFDLDNTLIHSKRKKTTDTLNTKSYRNADCELEKFYVWKRPFALSTLWILSRFTNLHMFTTATQPYADEIIHKMGFDPYFKSRFYRHNKTGESCKNLKKISDNRNVMLIDDRSFNQCEDQEMYHIKSYRMYHCYDIELVKLIGHVLWIHVKKLSN